MPVTAECGPGAGPDLTAWPLLVWTEARGVMTEDGRALNGFLVEKDEKIVVLRGADGQNIIVNRDKIDDMRVIPQSLMPEGLLKGLNEQQVRDLFAYLRSTQPLAD